MTVLAASVAGLAGLGAGAFVIHAQAPAAPPPPATASQTVASVAVADAAPSPVIAPTPAPAAASVAARAAPAKAPASREASIVVQPASCEKSAAGSSCRRAVIQADRHLRDVYQRAVRRGVPREVLVDYRDRWADLRQDATDDPAHLVRGYGALASDLGRESRDGDRSARRRRNPTGLKALTSALTSWW
jgi:hypothetical protein